jgi:hypothetical protein
MYREVNLLKNEYFKILIASLVTVGGIVLAWSIGTASDYFGQPQFSSYWYLSYADAHLYASIGLLSVAVISVFAATCTVLQYRKAKIM